MFTIKIVQTFSNESVCIRKKKEFQNACFGFQIFRAPPSWIVMCRGRPIVPEQSLFVPEQRGNHDTSQLFKMAATVKFESHLKKFEQF